MGLKEKMMEGMMDKMSAEEMQKAMEAMMEKFLGGLSSEDKSKMMEGMMEKFLGGMSAEERGRMMAGMMPKMMGEGGPMGMMGMMRMMMGGGKTAAAAGEKGPESGGEMPWDMCRKMMGAMTEGAQTARFATPEVRGLFDEWAAQIEEEMLHYIQETGEVDEDKTAEHFKLSRESTVYFLTRLAQKGKIKFGSRKEP
jgi:hypothetical protein